MKWGLTGTPGTGKTTVANAVDLPTLHLSDLLDESRFRAGYDEERETAIADIDAIAAYLHDQPDELLVESHLAHLLPVDRVIVLRCHPDELDARLTDRNTEPPGGVAENVEAERLDIILGEAIERHGIDAVHEVDTTDRPPARVVDTVEAILAGDTRARPGEISFLTDS